MLASNASATQGSPERNHDEPVYLTPLYIVFNVMGHPVNDTLCGSAILVKEENREEIPRYRRLDYVGFICLCSSIFV